MGVDLRVFTSGSYPEYRVNTARLLPVAYILSFVIFTLLMDIAGKVYPNVTLFILRKEPSSTAHELTKNELAPVSGDHILALAFMARS